MLTTLRKLAGSLSQRLPAKFHGSTHTVSRESAPAPVAAAKRIPKLCADNPDYLTTSIDAETFANLLARAQSTREPSIEKRVMYHAMQGWFLKRWQSDNGRHIRSIARIAAALHAGLSPMTAFQALDDQDESFGVWLDALEALLRLIGTDALLTPNDEGIPMWRAAFDNYLCFTCKHRPRALVLLVFKNAGCPLTMDDLVNEAVTHGQTRFDGYVHHEFLHHGAPDLVDALLTNEGGLQEMTGWQFLCSLVAVGMAPYTRVLLKHGFQANKDHLRIAWHDALTLIVQHGDVLARCFENGEWMWWMAAEERKERIRIMFEHGVADDLNAPVTYRDKPYPAWVMLLNASLGPPAQSDNAQVDETIFQALMARGADITRDGIARHFPVERKAQAVTACFEVLDRVRRHVEEMELRAVVAQVEAEAGEEAPVYVRRRM